MAALKDGPGKETTRRGPMSKKEGKQVQKPAQTAPVDDDELREPSLLPQPQMASEANSSTQNERFCLGSFLHCVGGTCTQPGFDVAEASEVPTAARLPSAAPPAVGTRGGGLDAGPAAQTLPRPVQQVQKAAKRALLLTARPSAGGKSVCRV